MILPLEPHLISHRGDEKKLVELVTKFEPRFNELYWKTKKEFNPVYLQCLLHYLRTDTDHDGIPDWTALIDQKPSRILFPKDSDMDGDGIENIMDPEPLIKNSSQKNILFFPPHLYSKNKEVLFWQEALWKRFEILAIEHTSDHSEHVLKDVYTLLLKTFPNKAPRWLKRVKHLYAFEKHDDEFDLAGFHYEAQAISIGGSLTYNKKLSSHKHQRLLSTIAHELGHAFLLEAINPREFQALGENFGWKAVYGDKKLSSLYAEQFFRELPNSTFFSDYASTNTHEWFAESFAESILATGKAPKEFTTWLYARLYSR